jgi:hypothetical protein
MKNPRVEIADGEYIVEKRRACEEGRPHTVTIEIINRRYKLSKRELHNYRANYYSRKK